MNWASIYMISFDHLTNDIVQKSGFSGYFVSKTSEFFENWYISDLIQKGAHKDAELFGVLSPYFFHKAMAGGLNTFKIRHDIERGYKKQVGRNIYEVSDLEALGFHPRNRQKNIITQGNRWHGEQFADITQMVFDKADIAWNVNSPLPRIVLHNYILAKPAIYEDYVKTILNPCMKVMQEDEELQPLLWQDSGYHKKKNMSQKLKDDLGVPYYPMHTFICERFWSVYLAMNPQIKFRHFGQ